jgi:hypothetical protein
VEEADPIFGVSIIHESIFQKIKEEVRPVEPNLEASKIIVEPAKNASITSTIPKEKVIPVPQKNFHIELSQSHNPKEKTSQPNHSVVLPLPKSFSNPVFYTFEGVDTSNNSVIIKLNIEKKPVHNKVSNPKNQKEKIIPNKNKEKTIEKLSKIHKDLIKEKKYLQYCDNVVTRVRNLNIILIVALFISQQFI